MRASRTRNIAMGVAALLCVVAMGLLLAPRAFSEEGRPQREPIPPEKLKEIREAQAKCVAAIAEVKGEDVDKVVKAFTAARQEYQDKAAALPRGQEGMQQRRELSEKSLAGLKEALTKAVGAEKTEKIIGIFNPFGMSSFFLDRMVGDLIAFQLPKEKFEKAMVCVLNYSKDLGKAMEEARQSGSFEAVREKREKLNEALNTEMAKLLSEEQMAKWKESTSRPFGGRRQQ